jgi:hypothetical protein
MTGPSVLYTTITLFQFFFLLVFFLGGGLEYLVIHRNLLIFMFTILKGLVEVLLCLTKLIGRKSPQTDRYRYTVPTRPIGALADFFKDAEMT